MLRQLPFACLLLGFICCFATEALAEPGSLPKTTPWDLKALSDPPKFEWIDQKSPVHSLYYTGPNYGGKPTRVFAYYASPVTLGTGESGKKYPAMVLVHGGGGTAFREWAELWAKRGYAAIAMDLAGHQPHEGKNAHQPANRTRLEDGAPNQGDDEKFGSVLKDPGEQWPYHAVADVILAHSLIRSFPEVDADKTGVTGISWGGYLTCIVSGVDSRFQVAVPVYGCGFLADNSAWTDRLNKMTDEQRTRWTQLWDPKQYLPAVRMPILFVNGTNDFAYPIDSYMKSYAAVPGEKQMRMTVNMPHGHPPGWQPQEIGLFVDQHLIGGKGLPQPSEPKLEGKQVKATCSSAVLLKEAVLHYSTDGGPINKRTWKSVPAQIDGETITAAAPPGDAAVWFLTVTDQRGAIISTPVVVK
jgi:cephalosporin-C deacetylase-like acetyl esterase